MTEEQRKILELCNEFKAAIETIVAVSEQTAEQNTAKTPKCKYCQTAEMNMIDPGDYGAVQISGAIWLLKDYGISAWKILSLPSSQTEKEKTADIFYCPMCGRKLET